MPGDLCAQEDAKMPGTCAWASLQFDTGAWVNASVALTADGTGMTLTATPPAGAVEISARSLLCWLRNSLRSYWLLRCARMSDWFSDYED